MSTPQRNQLPNFKFIQTATSASLLTAALNKDDNAALYQSSSSTAKPSALARTQSHYPYQKSDRSVVPPNQQIAALVQAQKWYTSAAASLRERMILAEEISYGLSELLSSVEEMEKLNRMNGSHEAETQYRISRGTPVPVVVEKWQQAIGDGQIHWTEDNTADNVLHSTEATNNGTRQATAGLEDSKNRLPPKNCARGDSTDHEREFHDVSTTNQDALPSQFTSGDLETFIKSLTLHTIAQSNHTPLRPEGTAPAMKSTTDSISKQESSTPVPSPIPAAPPLYAATLDSSDAAKATTSQKQEELESVVEEWIREVRILRGKWNAGIRI